MGAKDVEALVQSGIDALRNGDAAQARALFDQIVAEGGAPPWLALAKACNMLGDAEGEEQALHGQLDLDRSDLFALLLMGELKVRQRDERAADSFFRAGLRIAAAMPSPPARLQPLLERARSFTSTAQRRFQTHLLERLAGAGIADDASPRVRQALDLLLGRTELYLQQPVMFYYPGLPQRQFYERAEFEWLAAIETALPALQDELAGVLAGGQEFEPYVTGDPARPKPNNPLLMDPSWGAYYFWRNGAPVEAHAARCPATMEALALAPIPVIAKRSPMALYSLLKPGTHIQPHHGLLNTRLICHVPLIAPEGCTLRVGNETRAWREGETLIFDDSFEHEAWNRSDRTRIVLLFEIWRPELDEAERAQLTILFESIDLFSSGDGPDA